MAAATATAAAAAPATPPSSSRSWIPSPRRARRKSSLELDKDARTSLIEKHPLDNAEEALGDGDNASVFGDAHHAKLRTDSQGFNRKRTVGVLGLAVMGFLAVSAGPYGIEDAVSAAGAGPTLLAVLLLPLLWGVPQAAMTAEMASWLDENGGYVVWVRRGCGNFWGFISSYNCLLSNVTDLPLYAILFSTYTEAWVLREFGVQLGWAAIWALKLGAVAVVVGVNLRGMTSVAIASLLMTIFIAAPFVLAEPAALISQEGTHLPLAPMFGIAKDGIQWGLFTSVLLWNYSGWDGLGTIAGEVHHPRRSYPLGILLALLLITAVYFVPIAVGIFIVPDSGSWVEGTLETIASRLAPWIGTWVAVGAVVSNLGEFTVCMSTTSRALWAMGRRKMVPPLLARETSVRVDEHGEAVSVPTAAVLAQTVVVLVLLKFCRFETLVVIDTLSNNVSLALESVAFMRLKVTEPDTPRPFAVPGGFLGAFIVCAPKFAIIIMSFVTTDTFSLVFICVAQVVFALLYVLRNHLAADPVTDAMDSWAAGSVSSDDLSSDDAVATTGGDDASPGRTAYGADGTFAVVVPSTPSNSAAATTHASIAADATGSPPPDAELARLLGGSGGRAGAAPDMDAASPLLAGTR